MPGQASAKIEVTPEMIEAGIVVLYEEGADDIGVIPCADDLVKTVYLAMARASRYADR